MHKFKIIAIVALAILAAFGGVAASPSTVAAATSASVGNCTVRAYAPTIVYINGSKYAQGTVSVTCSVSRSGYLYGQVREADPVIADTNVSNLTNKYFSLFAGQTTNLTVRGLCRNFDSTGKEELYTQGRLNVGGINSAYANSAELSTTC